LYTVVNVDDEPLIKKTLKVLVEGYKDVFTVVGEAEDGRQALELIESLQPDLVITDMNMPIMNGIELIDAMRERGLKSYVTVISGYDDFAYTQQALRRDVLDYVLKPIRPVSISTMLDRVLSRLEKGDGQKAGTRNWLPVCGSAAEEILDKLWLLDEAGVKNRLSQFRGEVLAVADEEGAGVLEEACLSMLTLLSSKLEDKGEHLLQPVALGDHNSAGDAERVMHAVEASLLERLAELRISRHVGGHQGIRRAVQYLEAHFTSPALTLPDAAKAAGMSQAHFSRTFKEDIGLSFIQYLTKLRLDRAKELLSSPSSKTWEVAEAVGYQEYAHFTKVFKKHIGLTPSEYRQRNTEKKGDVGDEEISH
jgi:two-component system response regulator YesN